MSLKLELLKSVKKDPSNKKLKILGDGESGIIWKVHKFPVSCVGGDGVVLDWKRLEEEIDWKGLEEVIDWKGLQEEKRNNHICTRYITYSPVLLKKKKKLEKITSAQLPVVRH